MKVSSECSESREELLERIGYLKRLNHRKSEKLDFLRDHVDQLIDEVQRKSRLAENIGYADGNFIINCLMNLKRVLNHTIDKSNTRICCILG